MTEELSTVSYLEFNSSYRAALGNATSPSSPSSSANVKVVPVVNQPLQALLLILILVAAILTNGSVILNISRDSLKLRMVHFLLIRHVCITDSVGAIFVLPVPLISFIEGRWIWGDTACAVISTTTACCWTMHLVAVALYRADRVFAVWLPTGRYPIVSARIVNGLLVLIWAVALTGSYLATVFFTPTFQPALALCIPNVPLVFFILVFSSYILGLIILTTGYVFAFISRRRKRKKRKRLAAGSNQSESGVTTTTTIVPTTTTTAAATAAAPSDENQPTSSNLSQQSNSKSAPQLPSDLCNNNKLPGNSKQVMFSESKSNSVESNNTVTPSSTSEHSVNTNHAATLRTLTPPLRQHTQQHQTHRRSHSDNVRVNSDNVRESVVSVQYRTLCKPDDSSDEYTGVEESVAEKLDECDEEQSCTEPVPTLVPTHHHIHLNNNHYHTHHHHGNSLKRPRSARCRVFASYAVSIGHLILYLPAMLVVGLLGAKLPAALAFMCAVVVYCEFIVQPIALLLVSPKLRNEVITMVKGFFKKHNNEPTDVVTSRNDNNVT